MKNLYASLFVLLFLAACGSYSYQNTRPRHVQLLDPPGYPPEVRAPESARRVLNW